MPDAGGIDGVAGGEIVGAVQHHVGVADQFCEPGCIGFFTEGVDLDMGVELFQCESGRIDLVHAYALFGMQNLALQIGQIDLVMIHQGDAANTCRGQIKRSGGAKSAGTDDQRSGSEQPALPFYAYLVEQDMARIAQQLLVIQIIHADYLWVAGVSAAGALTGVGSSTGVASFLSSALLSPLASVFSALAT